VAAATKSPGKTDFVKKFLQRKPQANTKAVNQAWKAAGMQGTISHPIVSDVRKQLALAGNQPGNAKTAVKANPGTRISRTAASPGKAMFVKEFLHDHPQGSVRSVNEAWQTAGFTGTIGKTIVYKVKSSLGLTGNLRGSTTKTRTGVTAKERARSRVETRPTVQQRVNRPTALDGIEADIDRLIFKVMAMGDLTEIEDSLRRTRRLLYGALTKG
jgi:hypothetical protein